MPGAIRPHRSRAGPGVRAAVLRVLTVLTVLTVLLAVTQAAPARRSDGVFERRRFDRPPDE